MEIFELKKKLKKIYWVINSSSDTTEGMIFLELEDGSVEIIKANIQRKIKKF